MNLLARKRLFFALILTFGLLAMTARSAIDPDLWWHLRTGQWIVENGQIPHADPFSFTRGSSPWISHEWLSELAFYQLWKHGGFAALIIFSALITTAGFLLLYLRCPASPHWAAACTVLGAMAAAPCWGVRPQMFTFTLASLLLWLVERAQQRPRVLLCVPLLFLLWLNLHAGFALAPVLLGLYALGLACEALAGSTPWPEARPLIVRLLAVVLLCLALVPLNPSGAQLYRYPFDTLRSHGMRSFIVEWFSPDFHQRLYAPFLLLFLLLFAALAAGHRQLKGRLLLPLLFTAFAALDAVRHIPIFTLLAVPVMAAAIPSRSKPPERHAFPRLTSPLRSALAVCLLALLTVFAGFRWTSLARSQNEVEAQNFPADAARFLAADPEPTRVFAYYDWGGYILWKLTPQYRVFLDGRADLYGDDILHQFQTAVQLHKGWRAVLDEWSVGVVLVPPNSALAQALLLDSDWSRIYRDSKADVFARASPPSASASPPEGAQDPATEKIPTRASANLRN